jgi:hypothetical protein
MIRQLSDSLPMRATPRRPLTQKLPRNNSQRHDAAEELSSNDIEDPREETGNISTCA